MISRAFTGLALASIIFGAGCTGTPSAEPPIVPIRNMYQQPRLQPQAHSEFFQDGRTMRQPVDGTIAREMEREISIQTGRTDDNSEWLLEVPAPVVERAGGLAALAQRGHERFDIYCAPCHAQSGDGNGMIARRATDLQLYGRSNPFAPTNLHSETVRHMPDGQLYATITNGVRTMPAYRQSVPLDDRWAIVAYVRALEMSQAGRTTAANTEQNQ